jgi:hypothetical protein
MNARDRSSSQMQKNSIAKHSESGQDRARQDLFHVDRDVAEVWILIFEERILP